MKTFLQIVLLILTPLLLTGCKKDEVAQTWRAHVQLTDTLTAQPVQGKIELWRGIQNPGTLPEQVKTVITDEQGFGTIEYSYFQEPSYLYLRVSRMGSITPHPGQDIPSFSRWFSVSKSLSNQVYEIAFEPYYAYSLTVDNVNCTGPTDSVWITAPFFNSEQTLESQGCGSTFFDIGSPIEGEHIVNTDSATFYITSKKNGVTTTFSETHYLTLGVLENITIEY